MRRAVWPLIGVLMAAMPIARAEEGGVAGFSGVQAMHYLEAICELGPRPSGSPGMAAQRTMLVKHFREAGARVTGQA